MGQGWLLNALLALVLWGLAAFFPKLTVQHVAPLSALFYEMIGGMFVAAPVFGALALGGAFRPEAVPAGMLFGALTGAAAFSGAIFFLHAIKHGNASIVVTLIALYPVVVIALSAVFLHETVTLKQAAGLVLALVSMALLVT